MDILSPVLEVKGIGEARTVRLKKLGISTVKDLAEHFPRTYLDRSRLVTVAEAEPDEVISIRFTVNEAAQVIRYNTRIVTKLNLSDNTGQMEAVWYNQPYMKNNFKKGCSYIFTGKVVERPGRQIRMQIDSPDYEAESSEMLSSCRIVPVYDATAGLSQKILRQLVKTAIDEIQKAGGFAELLPDGVVRECELVSREYAINNIHFPESDAAFFQARRRLVFEELFVMHLMLLQMKGLMKEQSAFTAKMPDISDALAAIGFDLTGAQSRVLAEIASDITGGLRMNRLVQGDVGCGKTALAILAAYIVIRNGKQAVLMAPTEVLANQHYVSFLKIFGSLDIKVAFLSGSQTKKIRTAELEAVSSGEAQMVIGTHAVIQHKVVFSDLGLVITDEQHRFGVRQRAILSGKGIAPHVLIMSATPIPRTLGMILYGDMDISIVDELPPGRLKVDTYSVTTAYRPRIYEFLKKQIAEGRQAYMICPSIEANPDNPDKMQDVTGMYAHLQEIFAGNRCAMLHGRMRPEQKQSIMQDFANGNIDLLISTTVIEVGVNVQNATVMVIENAERFGLAQLHQLRGRVGRGGSRSYCVLITDSSSKVCKKRMKAMSESGDGFYISELDLKLRGSGDFMGTRQHGLPDLKIANLYEDLHILDLVRQQAERVLSEDFKLQMEKHSGIKAELAKKRSFIAIL